MQPNIRKAASFGIKRSERAFTLIEVCLALAVSAIVLAAIGGVFFSGIRLRERTTAALDRAAPLQQALNLIRRDLQGALPPAGGTYSLAQDFRTEVLSAGLGQNDRLSFFTTTGVMKESVPWGDIQEVVYELHDSIQKTDNKGRDLVRTVYRDLLATGQPLPDEQWLMGNVQGLQFSCYDGFDWRDSWDTSLGDTNLPKAVRVRIQLSSENTDNRAEEPFELVVPVVVQSRTNATTTTQ